VALPAVVGDIGLRPVALQVERMDGGDRVHLRGRLHPGRHRLGQQRNAPPKNSSPADEVTSQTAPLSKK